MSKRIFTFWDDEAEMPAYIQLCIDSWKKYLPNYEIVVLNYSNLENWLPKDFYDKILYDEFKIAQQTQAIRAAILEKHGGFWFDADIIVTNPNIEKFFDENCELNIFENRIACLKAKKHSKILKKWIKGIKWNLFIYKHLFDFYFMHFPSKASEMMNWDYLSDQILNKLYKTKNKKLLNNIRIADSKTYLENLWDKECNRSKFKDCVTERYNHFYINNDFSDYANKNEQGLIILHNSWMPREYAKLTKEQVLAKNNTLAKIFQRVL